METITKIATASLHAHPLNTEYFDDAKDAAFENLKDSIKTLGALTPLRIAPDMTILSGHQRWKACKELGIETVPCIISEEATDNDAKEIELIASNFGRLKNDPIKQAKMIQEYERLNGVRMGRKKSTENFCTFPSKSQQDIANELGVDVTTLQNIKRLATLPVEYQDLISQGTMKPSTGYKIITQLSEEDQMELLHQLQELPANQKLTAALIQQKIEEMHIGENLAEELDSTMKKWAAEKKAHENAEKTNKNMLQTINTERNLRQEAEGKVAEAQSEIEGLKHDLSMTRLARDQVTTERDSLNAKLQEVQLAMNEAEKADSLSEAKSKFFANFEMVGSLLDSLVKQIMSINNSGDQISEEDRQIGASCLNLIKAKLKTFDQMFAPKFTDY